MFSTGISFVFRSELPPSTDDTSEDEVQPPADEPDHKPNRRILMTEQTPHTSKQEKPKKKGGSRVIENYVPADQGWGIVLGRLAQPPSKTPSPEKSEEPVAPEEDPQAE
jgi:hypothetical protein